MQLTARACSYERMNIQRLFARALIVFGGVFWAVAAFGADYFYSGAGITESLGGVIVPLVLAVVALAVGWFYERIAAIGLGVGAVGIVAWGLISGWEIGSWMGVGMLVLIPMALSATLLWLAANMEDRCRNETAHG